MLLSKLYLKQITLSKMKNHVTHHHQRGVPFVLCFLLAKSGAEVFIWTHHSIVGSRLHGSLEKRIHHSLSSGDILLVIRHIVGKPFPSVLFSLLILVDFCNHLKASRCNLWVGESWAHLLQTAPEEGGAWDWTSSTRAVQAQLHQSKPL